MVPLAEETNCFVVAPDQRGAGRTTGWENRAKYYNSIHIEDFSATNLVRDLVVFIHSIGYSNAKCVVGHDFGAVSASMLALMRPDMVGKLVLMSHPFKKVPSITPVSSGSSESTSNAKAIAESVLDAKATEMFHALGAKDLSTALAALNPARKHYRSYNSTSGAVKDWNAPFPSLREFLLGYFHVKSALFGPNSRAGYLKALTAEEMGRMPFYYIMPLQSSMSAAIKQLLVNENDDARRSLSWLPEEQLTVYVSEWQRTGFLAALTWYRARNDPERVAADLALFAGKEILEIPTLFISGAQDWGNYQEPGALESMESGKSCSDFRGKVLIDGAGHWVQQEQPRLVIENIVKFVT
jgi:pimeloyl-ACP methyl ester carboxylesterase